jgi:hypothetical protein
LVLVDDLPDMQTYLPARILVIGITGNGTAHLAGAPTSL